jgi:hypothetical protein
MELNEVSLPTVIFLRKQLRCRTRGTAKSQWRHCLALIACGCETILQHIAVPQQFPPLTNTPKACVCVSISSASRAGETVRGELCFLYTQTIILCRSAVCLKGIQSAIGLPDFMAIVNMYWLRTQLSPETHCSLSWFSLRKPFP